MTTSRIYAVLPLSDSLANPSDLRQHHQLFLSMLEKSISYSQKMNLKILLFNSLNKLMPSWQLQKNVMIVRLFIHSSRLEKVHPSFANSVIEDGHIDAHNLSIRDIQSCGFICLSGEDLTKYQADNVSISGMQLTAATQKASLNQDLHRFIQVGIGSKNAMPHELVFLIASYLVIDSILEPAFPATHLHFLPLQHLIYQPIETTLTQLEKDKRREALSGKNELKSSLAIAKSLVTTAIHTMDLEVAYSCITRLFKVLETQTNDLKTTCTLRFFDRRPTGLQTLLELNHDLKLNFNTFVENLPDALKQKLLFEVIKLAVHTREIQVPGLIQLIIQYAYADLALGEKKDGECDYVSSLKYF